jgi:ABC-type multidrug transport system permease subunit
MTDEELRVKRRELLTTWLLRELLLLAAAFLIGIWINAWLGFWPGMLVGSLTGFAIGWVTSPWTNKPMKAWMETLR